MYISGRVVVLCGLRFLSKKSSVVFEEKSLSKEYIDSRIKLTVERIHRATYHEEASKHCESWIPKKDDIIICGYPKSGHTWMSQIVHQIRSKGDIEFSRYNYAYSIFVDDLCDGNGFK